MKAFKLDCWSSWKYLPWIQIKERIFLLQKQIYQASKSCKYYSIHKMQNTLINSNEAKVLAIEEILKSLSKSSLYYNKNYFKLNDEDKLLIFYSLFQKQKIDTVLKILVEKTKQYLIYLCLSPEWEARFEPGLQSNIDSKESYLLQEKLVSFLDYKLNLPKNWHGIYFKYQMINKYINPKYINRKIQSGFYVKYCLNFWLDSNYIKEFAQDLILSLKFNALHQLLYRIICNGIEWFSSISVEFQLKNQQYNIDPLNICHDINTGYWAYISCNFIFIMSFIFILKFLGLSINKYHICYAKYKNHSFCIGYYYICNLLLNTKSYLYTSKLSNTIIIENICKHLFILVKSVLYTKDFINRLRVNTSINISKVILNINNSILQLYNYYILFLPLKIIKYIYQEIDFIFYSWLKKRSKNKYFLRVTMHRNKKYFVKSLTKSKNYIIKKICLEKLNR